MEIRKFKGGSLAEALRQAVDAGGPDVPIVETRKRGGLVEVTVGIRGGRRAGPPRRVRPAPAFGDRLRPGERPLAERMKRAGLSIEIRKTVLEALRRCDLVLDRPGDPAILPLAARILGGLFRRRPLPSADRPVLAMVGPTGVGKTTTLAKLASRAAIDEGREVALITMDTYRMAAVEQMRAFADLLGAPLSVVFTPNDLRDALRRHRGAERIFIDTTGRGAMDLRRVREIRSFLQSAEAATLLALPAGARIEDLRAAGRTFGILRPVGLVITKWDETRLAGETLTYSLEADLPLTWVTDGQEVPDDIHPARPEVLAAAILRDTTIPEATRDLDE